MGSIGVISLIANTLPDKLSQLTNAALNGNMALAGQLHLKMAEMLKLIFKEGNPGGAKALMEMMGNAKNYLRLPLVPVSATTFSLIEAEWKKIS